MADAVQVSAFASWVSLSWVSLSWVSLRGMPRHRGMLRVNCLIVRLRGTAASFQGQRAEEHASHAHAMACSCCKKLQLGVSEV